jgi:hypothetical protein
MSRSRGNNSDRGNRFNTYVSGVTFQTNPSGVTLSKGSGIQGNVMTNSGGAGYTLPFTSASGLLCAAGQVGMTTGVTKIEAAYFGFAAIHFCIANAGVTNLMNKTGTTGHLYVTTSKAIPATGVSRVYFRWLNGGGAVIPKPVSVQYFVVGV